MSRLEGTTLSSRNVRYYVTNNEGEITHLILEDATGDFYDYGLVTQATENTSGMSVTSSYTYIVNGTTKNYTSMNSAFGVSTGGARFGYQNGTISSIKNLSQGSVSSITTSRATIGGKSIDLAEDVQVYLKDGSNYSLINLNTVLGEENYRLTAWYDNFGYPAGGLVRVIVATER